MAIYRLILFVLISCKEYTPKEGIGDSSLQKEPTTIIIEIDELYLYTKKSLDLYKVEDIDYPDTIFYPEEILDFQEKYKELIFDTWWSKDCFTHTCLYE